MNFDHIKISDPDYWKKEADRYRRAYRTVLAFWLPLSSAAGVLAGDWLCHSLTHL